MRRLVVLSLLLCMIWPSLSRAQGLPQEELRRGVKYSDACSFHLMKEARLNRPAARALLEKALACSPDLPSAYFALSKSSLSFSIPGILESIDYMVQGVSAYSRNFWWSFSLAASLFFGLILSFVVTVMLVIVTRLFRDIPLLTHDISESRRMVAVLPVLLLAAFTGPLVLLGCLLVILGLYMKKTDRIVLYFYLLLLFISPLIFQTASFFVDSYSSGSLKAVVQTNYFQGNRYALSVLDGNDDYDALFSYALALKHEGRYEDAIALNERLIRIRPDARVYVNLGNCYVGLYHFDDIRKSYLDKAFDYYKKALTIKPLASAYFNLAQVSRERLDFTGGNEYYRSALGLDRDKVARYSLQSSRTPNRFVADEALPAAALWKDMRSRYGKILPLGMTPVPVMLFPFFAMLLLAGFYLLDTRLRERAYRCRKCGKVLCAKCERSLIWGRMCPQCYASLIKLDELDVKERVARLLAIYEHGRSRRNMLKVLSFTLPGIAQIFSGRILSGFALLWPFLFFVSIPLTQSVFSPGDLSGYHPLSWLAAALAACLWMASQFITREKISRGWL